MMNLLLLLLLAAAGLSLTAALFFLYRYLVRSKLFPQLPRIWSGDRRRFLLLLGVCLLSLVAFAVVGFLTRPVQPPPPQLGHVSPSAGPAAPGGSAPEEPTRLAAPELPRPDRSAPMPEAPPETGHPAATPAPAREERAMPPQPAPLPEATAPAPAASGPGEVLPAPPASPPPPPPPSPAPAQAKPGTLASPSPQAASAPATPPVAPPPAPPEAPAAVASTPDKPAPKPAASQGAEVLWVCLGSFKDEAAAKASQAKLKAQGLETSLWQVDLGAKGRWCRVCAGEFSSQTQAQAQAQAWKKQGLDPSPFVARKPDR